jgi:fructosamine-3-kinase
MIPSQVLEKVTGFLQSGSSQPVHILSVQAISGGCINHTFQIKTNQGIFFLKYNMSSRFPQMFQKEAKGLELLRSSGSFDVPEVLLTGEAGDFSFLLLQFIDSAPMKDDFWNDFGKSLAALHSHKAEKFGLDHDNFMGSLEQRNNFHENWIEFFIIERLELQVRLAREKNALSKTDVQAFERLYQELGGIFPKASPSLLHGDLWSGNFMINHQGKPCLIDPAVYYGHPEIDIAMTTLFGGFSQRFYEVYNHHNPLEKGWKNRLDIYNLYPLMIHVNFFGGGYLGSVQGILGRF